MAVWALELLHQLSSTENQSIALARCGDPRLDALLTSPDHALEDALHESHRRMASSDSDTSRWLWRRYYTDACIVLALSDLAAAPDTRTATSAVSRLDHAIVIAGAAGRLDFIHPLIERIQTEYLIAPAAQPDHPPIHLATHPTHAPPPPSPPSFPPSAPSAPPPSSAPIPIRELREAPSLPFFRAQLSSRPFVLRDALAAWPALTTRPWASPAYLRAAAGPGRVVPVEIGHDYRAADWAQAMLPWDAFLDALCSSQSPDNQPPSLDSPTPSADSQPPSPDNHPSATPPPVLYLAQHNLFLQFPALRDDILIPDYVYAAPDAPGYAPPPTADQLLLNAWLGPAGTLSPAHTDPYFNLYAQVVGSKTVWLAPPSATPHMATYPPNTPAHNPAHNTTAPAMSNTSRIDVFSARPTSDAAHDPDAAAFWTHVPPLAMHTRLGPGDLLFFPPGWWHAMRSDSTSFSVSMWF